MRLPCKTAKTLSKSLLSSIEVSKQLELLDHQVKEVYPENTRNNEILATTFSDINSSIASINKNRNGDELVIDFLKSIANTITYLITLTTYPGFFKTTTQPLQDLRITIRNTATLLEELNKIDSTQEAPKQFMA